ncbi:putative ArCR [uncultured archaeon]|nr:putative ArCR [uncultured archaeon]
MILNHIRDIMSRGKPVAVTLCDEKSEDCSLLYCELIQKARYGEFFIIKNQGCPVGAYVLGDTDKNPSDYYYDSGRYKDKKASEAAVSSLRKLEKRNMSISIAPYSGGDFDVLILFLTPERAMRIIQAYTYRNGNPARIKSGGIASVCSDCTVSALEGNFVISPGCKGSRKHSKYGDDEIIIGLPRDLAERIDEALGKIPETRG